MVGLDRFSPRPYLDFAEPGWPIPERTLSARWSAPGPRPELALGPWTPARAAGSETASPWQALPLRHSPPPWPGRGRGYPASPWESRSLTDMAQRAPDRARKQRPYSRRLENAWGEARSKGQRLGGGGHSLTWQPPQLHQPQPCQQYPPAQGDSPPPGPRGAYTPLRAPIGGEDAQNGNRWAVPVRRDCWSFSPGPTGKSSMLSKGSTCSASGHPPERGGQELLESLGGQYSQLEGSSETVSCEELPSQPSQILRSKLADVVISSRDQKIVALVLARLQKAQKMRELQQQAAVAWEELKRSDQKVQMTLAKERRLLLQQSQEQWQQQKEQPKGHLCCQRHAHHQDREGKAEIQKEKQLEAQGKLVKARAPAEHRKQCQVRQLMEEERVQEQNILQLQKRLEQASHKRHLHALEDLTRAQETNLTSIINYQARKVLMDCQAKAEELLKKLSLEQRSQELRETHAALGLEHHRELREKEPKEDKQLQQVRWRVGESQEQKQRRQRMLMELVDDKLRPARSSTQGNIKDRVKHARELSVLREKHHHVLKLKAEKEEKGHIEGIKEAIRKKQQRREQISRENAAALEDFQKLSRAALQMRDPVRALPTSSLDQKPWEAQFHAHQPRGSY
ncbi:coiled-coil domain-containing protein 185 [Echinops telfairi]|uniref:Coiled-coil domain-containing protein 185 n=1 Tax=Echinops telfairi TaxID=9371 RepID=A0ABM0IHJ7_ECHTE|nr:coiled-coil domain-containing protein 185 [Echinops telfairi]